MGRDCSELCGIAEKNKGLGFAPGTTAGSRIELHRVAKDHKIRNCNKITLEVCEGCFFEGKEESEVDADIDEAF